MLEIIQGMETHQQVFLLGFHKDETITSLLMILSI